MALVKGTQIATIDVVLVTLVTTPTDGSTVKEIAFETGNQITVTPVVETQDNIPLINLSSGVLLAQKRGKTTITGNTIVINDNVFTPEVAQILQGGTLDLDNEGVPIHYEPPIAGSEVQIPYFNLTCYTAQYDKAGMIVRYEKIVYPNCSGNPIFLNSQDNVFRVPEYTINSAPGDGQAPYTIDWIDELPTVTTPTPTNP